MCMKMNKTVATINSTEELWLWRFDLIRLNKNREASQVVCLPPTSLTEDG